MAPDGRKGTRPVPHASKDGPPDPDSLPATLSPRDGKQTFGDHFAKHGLGTRGQVHRLPPPFRERKNTHLGGPVAHPTPTPHLSAPEGTESNRFGTEGPPSGSRPLRGIDVLDTLDIGDRVRAAECSKRVRRSTARPCIGQLPPASVLHLGAGRQPEDLINRAYARAMRSRGHPPSTGPDAGPGGVARGVPQDHPRDLEPVPAAVRKMNRRPVPRRPDGPHARRVDRRRTPDGTPC